MDPTPRSSARADALPLMPDTETAASAVSWPAIFAGALAAAAISLILLALGSGLGFAALSPWTNAGASAATLGVGSIVWLMVMGAIASAIGGYLAGRLRTKWTNVHTDEVYFRDTAHGFLSWAVATVLTAAVLTSAASSIVAGVAKAGVATVAVGTTAVAGAGAAAAGAMRSADGSTTASPTGIQSNGYYVDALFRSERPNTADTAPLRAEAGRIMVMNLAHGELNTQDKAYLAQIVASNTGITPSDADQRVTQTYERARRALVEAETAAKEVADTARKAAAALALWMFVSLLLGAFSGSYAATIGGRQRDDVVPR